VATTIRERGKACGKKAQIKAPENGGRRETTLIKENADREVDCGERPSNRCNSTGQVHTHRLIYTYATAVLRRQSRVFFSLERVLLFFMESITVTGSEEEKGKHTCI
jgi:hypothetical protein